jgi:hypothetical protein
MFPQEPLGLDQAGLDLGEDLLRRHWKSGTSCWNSRFKRAGHLRSSLAILLLKDTLSGKNISQLASGRGQAGVRQLEFRGLRFGPLAGSRRTGRRGLASSPARRDAPQVQPRTLARSSHSPRPAFVTMSRSVSSWPRPNIRVTRGHFGQPS